jgi:lipoprotein NlpI
MYKQSLTCRPDCTAVHYNLALLYMNHGEKKEALHHASRCVEIDPGAEKVRGGRKDM